MFVLCFVFKPPIEPLKASPWPSQNPNAPFLESAPLPWRALRPTLGTRFCERVSADGVASSFYGNARVAGLGGRLSRPALPSLLDRTFSGSPGVIAADTQRGAPAVRAPRSSGLAYIHTHWMAVLFTNHAAGHPDLLLHGWWGRPLLLTIRPFGL